MIQFACDKCEKMLEVDDDLAGRKVECPYCSDTNVVPSRVVARAASVGGADGVASAEGRARRGAGDRATAMGLPPDSGPEEHVMTVHPAMFRARPMQGSLIGLMFVGGCVCAVMFGPPGWIGGGIAAGIALVWWLAWYVRSRMVSLIITNKRSTMRVGLLSKDTREVLHDRVQDIQINQSFLQRVTNIGRLGLSSSGEAGVEIVVADLPNPGRLRDIIDAYRNASA